MFQHLTAYAGDPILSLVEAFQNDSNPNKVNLGIGIYLDETGQLFLPDSVRQAQESLIIQALSYAPMEGLTSYRRAVEHLIFGADSQVIQQKRVATVQTLGGTGALKLGADFLKNHFPYTCAYISNPSWDNHHSIFQGAGIPTAEYPYYNFISGTIDFAAMCDHLAQLPTNSIIVLHPCCHNPTGIDLNIDQWNHLLDLMKNKNLIPFMDMAYQGFATDFYTDAYPIRRAIDIDLNFLLSYSFSKNMGLYAQRIGALSVVCTNAHQAELVLGQLKFAVRRIYSSPPIYGAQIVNQLLHNANLYQQWQNDITHMRQRLITMRQILFNALQHSLPERDFNLFTQQNGMFSYTKLTSKQVHFLREKYAIYLLDSGRLCIAGLNQNNIDYVAQALAHAYSL